MMKDKKDFPHLRVHACRLLIAQRAASPFTKMKSSFFIYGLLLRCYTIFLKNQPRIQVLGISTSDEGYGSEKVQKLTVPSVCDIKVSVVTFINIAIV